MKRLKALLNPVSATILLSSLLTWPCHGVQLFRLANGLTVLVDPDHRLPLVNVTCLYRVGSVNESPGITGIAHYVEHMNYRASAGVSQADVTGFVNRVGGRWNGYTSLEQTLYAATVPSWALEELFRIESQRMSASLFDPDDFERERTSVIAELQGYENDPGFLLWDLGVATSFEIHPYRYNIIGWLDDVLSIKREQAFRFYKEHYGPNNAVLAVVGDTEVSRVRKLVQDYFAALKPAPRTSPVNVIEPQQRGEKRAMLLHPAADPQLLLLYRAPAATSRDFAVLAVLDALLAGGDDLLSLPGTRDSHPSGLLGARLEGRGVTGAETALTPTRSPYVYGIRLLLSRMADPEAILRNFSEELTSLVRTAGEADLAEARGRLSAYREFATDELAERAHRLAYFEGLGDWKRAELLEQEVAHVNRADLLVYVSSWLQPHQRTVASLERGKLEVEAPVVPAAVVAAREESAKPSAVPDSAFEPRKVQLPKMQRKRSNSGLRLAAATLAEGPATLLIRLGIGANLDPHGKAGLALLSSRFVGPAPDDLAKLDRLGAIYVSRDPLTSPEFAEYLEIRISFLPRDLERVVSLLGNVLRIREISERSLNLAREDLEESLKGLQLDSGWRARQAASERLFAERAPVYGTTQSRASLRVDDVKVFLRDHLHAGGIWGSIAGPWAPERGLAILESILEDVPNRPERADRLVSDRPNPARLQQAARVEVPGKTQAQVFAALRAPAGPGSPRPALEMLNYILGETGYAGRLGRALVDRGLTYSVYSTLPELRGEGLWTIETGAAPSNLNAVLEAIRDQIEALSSGTIESWELREAQAYLLGKLLRRLETSESLAGLLMEELYLELPERTFQKRREEILAVGLEQLRSVARSYLHPEGLSLAAAGSVQ